MTDYGIKPEWAQAWRWASRFASLECKEHDLYNLALHLLAGWMECQWNTEHFFHEGYCDCRTGMEADPRHTYRKPDWLADARKKLEGVR